MTIELSTAVASYEASMQRALLMTRLQDIAEGLDNGSAEDQEIAYIIRGVWIAVHQKRVSELYMLIDPLVERMIDEPPRLGALSNDYDSVGMAQGATE